MLSTALLLICFILSVYVFLKHPKFGKLPSGERLKRIQESPNYRLNQFQNIHHTPDLTEGSTYFSVLKKVLFEKSKRSRPTDVLPSQKTDLHALEEAEDVMVWFGHSSYFIQAEGKRILVDPVFSGAASPIKATTRSFKGSDVYTVDDMPEIDYLFLTHDHWDHLDYETVLALKPKVKTIITSLGTAAHLEHWGFDLSKIIEKDWNQHIDLGFGFTVDTVPGRHFAGRGLKRNKALWMAFVLQTPNRRLFIGGDSGYDTHFATIGETFGPFDLAMIECGQYDLSWRYIHLLPEEIIMAAKDLNANAIMPVHWGKFALGNHEWDEPIIRITGLAKAANLPLVTPMIGEKVNLNAPGEFVQWWKGIN